LLHRNINDKSKQQKHPLRIRRKMKPIGRKTENSFEFCLLSGINK